MKGDNQLSGNYYLALALFLLVCLLAVLNEVLRGAG